MCLLIAMFGTVTDAPLIVAANRDESYARPSVTMTTLRDGPPRIVGGRDELAGGTWLAVNEHGLVAGLTNQPSSAGRDPAKRSRGELPLAFAAHRSARAAVQALGRELDPADYNPCWLLVGDRESLFFVTVAGGSAVTVEELPPGLHILENAPLRAPSAKTAHVAGLLDARRTASASQAAGTSQPAPQNAVAAADALAAVLADHAPADPASAGRPPAFSAACVHTPQYGTRSAIVVTVPPGGLPGLRVADGPPCEVPFQDATAQWSRPAAL